MLSEALVKTILKSLAAQSDKQWEFEEARLVSAMVLPNLDGDKEGAVLKLVYAELEKLIVVPDMHVKEDVFKNVKGPHGVVPKL